MILFKKILFVLVLALSGFVGFYAAKTQAKLDNTLNMLNHDVQDKLSNVDLSGIQVNSDDEVINILLMGVDEREDLHDEGRSDSTMIATLDKKNKRLKLTSLMRDMYVEIPGYGQDKFNAAYAYGGPELVYKTIAQNFGIQLDGYVEVNFSAFVKVVRAVGGIEIELSEREAEYLNTTNYISRKKYRNVKAGKHRINGYQALGYSRVRYVPTIDGLENDYGRTARQRRVMQAVFSKVKSQSMSKWLSIAKEVLPEITTDLTNEEIMQYITDIIMLGTTELDQMRIPVDGAYTESKINGADVLEVDLTENTNKLQDFLFNYRGEK